VTHEVDLNQFTAECARTHVVIDVREPEEYAEGHVPGARSIPLSKVPERIDGLPSSRPIYVVCATGNRSMAAAELMSRAGLAAFSVSGGTSGWRDRGRPVVTGPSPL
jgi:rhodanese-related sulfurtransferase